MMVIITVLGFSGCHNKIPETKWLKQQQFISHSYGDLKFKIKVLADSFPQQGLSSWLADGYLLTVSSHDRNRESKHSGVLIRALIPSQGPHPHDLI